MGLKRTPKVRELVEFLKEKGCTYEQVDSTSHQKWRTPGGTMFPIVVNHKNAEVSPNVLATVRRHLRAEGVRL